MRRATTILLLAVLLLPGCFFQTRDPEPPVLGGGCEVEFVFIDSVEDALNNLEGALLCGQAGEYENVLTESFLYVPSLDLGARYPDTFDTVWDNEREVAFVEELFQASRFEAALAENVTSRQEDGDRIILTVDYQIEDLTGGTIYQETARLIFLSGGLYTRLDSWEDLGEGDRPFGELRGELGGDL